MLCILVTHDSQVVNMHASQYSEHALTLAYGHKSMLGCEHVYVFQCILIQCYINTYLTMVQMVQDWQMPNNTFCMQCGNMSG